MKDFAALYRELDASTSSLAKQAALQRYLREADPADAAWAVYFLAGGKPRQLVPTKLLRLLAQEAAGLPEWLFDESYEAVGDLAETIALLLPPPTEAHDLGLARWVEEHLLPLREAGKSRARRVARQAACAMAPAWRPKSGWCTSSSSPAHFAWACRSCRSRRRSRRWAASTPSAWRSGSWATPTSAADRGPTTTARSSRRSRVRSRCKRPAGSRTPSFLRMRSTCRSKQFDAALGPPADWVVEWKWDGIRAQLVKRAGAVWLWSRGEELVTERFPELAVLGEALPDGTVLDGEIAVWREDRVQPFAELQKRIGRKTLGAKLLREIPVVLLAYDILEWEGRDLRALPQWERRALLDELVTRMQHPSLLPSPMLTGTEWSDLARQREAARSMGVEGMMLKRRDAQYGVGRTKDVGVWWKWKIDPLSIDAVLIYAQRGHGRRASLYSDYTFAVWDGPPEQQDRKLVPFAKAYSGLTDAEMARVDAIIRKTTVESFGPVRSVEPTLVFELGFEGIARSTRHKSGIAVRFPRMLRWREDKPVAEADTLQTLAALLPS